MLSSSPRAHNDGVAIPTHADGCVNVDRDGIRVGGGGVPAGFIVVDIYLVTLGLSEAWVW